MLPPRNDADIGTIAPRQNAEGVMFDLMKPAGTGWRHLGGRR